MSIILSTLFIIAASLVLAFWIFRMFGHAMPCPKCGSRLTLWANRMIWELPEDRVIDMLTEAGAISDFIEQETCVCLHRKCKQTTVIQNGREIDPKSKYVLK